MKTGRTRTFSPSSLPEAKIYSFHVPKRYLAMISYPVNYFQHFDATSFLNFKPGFPDFYYVL